MDALLGLDPFLMFVVLAAAVCAAVVIGFFIRKITRFDCPKDFMSISFFILIGAAAVLGTSAGHHVVLLPLFFFTLGYLLGFFLGSYVAHKEFLEFVQMVVDEDKIIHFRIESGDYYNHPKHGLIRLPQDNAELFAAIFRNTYHKVELNAPLETLAYIEDAGGRNKDRKVPLWDKKIHENVVDDEKGRKVILVEDIDVTTRHEKGRILRKTISKTSITLAYGSMIPRAHLLAEIKTLDTLNRNMALIMSETLKVKTEVISTVPRMAAEQLIKVADDNPVMEMVRQYMENEEADRLDVEIKKKEKKADKKAAKEGADAA